MDKIETQEIKNRNRKSISEMTRSEIENELKSFQIDSHPHCGATSIRLINKKNRLKS